MSASQRSVTRLYLLDGAALITANVTTGTAVDLSTYGDVGRREMRISFATAGMTGTTSVACVIQDCTTSTAASALWANATSNAAIATRTTNGHSADTWVSTNKRYLRAVATPAASTTSYAAICTVDVDNRVS